MLISGYEKNVINKGSLLPTQIMPLVAIGRWNFLVTYHFALKSVGMDRVDRYAILRHTPILHSFVDSPSVRFKLKIPSQGSSAPHASLVQETWKKKGPCLQAQFIW